MIICRSRAILVQLGRSLPDLYCICYVVGVKDVFDVLILGSGPSGLTAGIYSGRANLKTLVVGGEKWGGQLMLTTEVENFPGFPRGIQGPELMKAMREQCERFAGKMLEEDVIDVDFSKRPFTVTTGQGKYLGKSVIVATGAVTKWLNLSNEQKLIGRGVSSCAPCDAPFFKNKIVAVIGGGDSAMEEALVLTKFAKSVVIVHRRDQFKASKIMQDRVLTDPKIQVIWNTQVEDVLGEGRVEGVRLATSILNLKLEISNFGGREISTAGGNLTWDMPVDGMFVAIGHIPATDVFKNKIELDEKGYVVKILNSRFQVSTMTSVEGVFVAGDVFDFHYKQAITAAGYGCMAAMDAEKWLGEDGTS